MKIPLKDFSQEKLEEEITRIVLEHIRGTEPSLVKPSFFGLVEFDGGKAVYGRKGYGQSHDLVIIARKYTLDLLKVLNMI